MRILAVDTTSAFGSLALLQDRELLEEMPIHSPDGFGQILFGHIERLLGRHEWDLTSVDCFAAAAGPGSFTGVRIGLAAVKGLAEATGKAATGLSNLQALASCGTAGVRGVVTDARRGEVYGAVYDSSLQIVAPEIVQPFPAWLAALPTTVTEVISSDLAPFRGALPDHFHQIEQRLLAASVARLAHERMLSGSVPDPAAVDANYVRRSDAELNWKDDNVARTS